MLNCGAHSNAVVHIHLQVWIYLHVTAHTHVTSIKCLVNFILHQCTRYSLHVMWWMLTFPMFSLQTQRVATTTPLPVRCPIGMFIGISGQCQCLHSATTGLGSIKMCWTFTRIVDVSRQLHWCQYQNQSTEKRLSANFDRDSSRDMWINRIDAYLFLDIDVSLSQYGYK